MTTFKSFKQLASLSSKMEHQMEPNVPMTMAQKAKNFHNTVGNLKLSAKNKGKLFMKTFGSH